MHQDAVTVSIVFVRSALAKVAAAALREQVLGRAGIPAALLTQPQARVSARQFADVWMGVVETLDDEFFGLDSRTMHRGSFALLCHAVVPARNVGQAMQRFLRGFALFLGDLRGELQVEGDRARLLLHATPPRTETARFAQEIFATVVHGVLCWLAGQRVPLTHAAFGFPRPPHGAEYLTMFSRSLQFDAPATELHFDAAWLGMRVAQDEAGLKRFLGSAPLSIFVKYRNPNSWSARVRRALRETEPSHWPSLQAMASALGIAASTLARRLAEEGTRYQRIKDELRRDQAVQLLSGSRRSIEEIALVLGFDDARAFYRAFRRWTGSPPGSYRAPLS